MNTTGMLLGVALILVLTACAAPEKQVTKPEVVVDTVMVEPEEIAPAPVVAPVEMDQGFQGHPLDDPDSLLSERVIYFDFDKSVLRDEFIDTIRAHAGYLVDHPSAELLLEGHADERGTREYNMALGARRAKAVQEFLQAQGASSSQIDLISYGEERPSALGHHESAWRLNRRVEMIYTRR